MIKRIVKYIKNNIFSFKFINNQIDIINYDEIKIITDELISITYNKDKILLIKGHNLSLTKMIDDELLIKGLIKSIEM